MKQSSLKENKRSKLSDFIILSIKAKNSFTVKRIIDDELYQMHIIPFNNTSIEYQQKEIELVNILSSIRTQYMIQYMDSFYDQSTNSLYIITELFSDRIILSEVIENHKSNKTFLDERDIISIMTSITQVMKAFNQMNISMPFLSSDYIYINNEYETKIDAFEGLFHSLPGDKGKNDNENSFKDDIRRFGEVLYEICTFNNKPFGNNKEKMIKGVYKPIPYGYSDSLGKIIKLCLQYLPQRRPTITQVISFIRTTFKPNKKHNPVSEQNSYKPIKKGQSIDLSVIQKQQVKDLKLNPLCFNQTAFNPKTRNDYHTYMTQKGNNSKSIQLIQPHYSQGKMHCKHNHELKHNKSFSIINQIKNTNKSLMLIKRKAIKHSKSVNKLYLNKAVQLNQLESVKNSNDTNSHNTSYDLNALVKLNNIQSMHIINQLKINHTSNKSIQL